MKVRNLSEIRTRDPRLYEALSDIVDGIKNVAQQTNASPSQQTPAPLPVSSVMVTAANGIHDVAISDVAPVYRGINYFLEYSLAPTFAAPTVLDLGASRNWRGMLGNQTLYWRAYSQYPTSPPSSPVYHGTATQPVAVSGGGTLAGPLPNPSTGSGTSSGEGGQGFGVQPYRSTTGKAPIRA